MSFKTNQVRFQCAAHFLRFETTKALECDTKTESGQDCRPIRFENLSPYRRRKSNIEFSIAQRILRLVSPIFLLGFQMPNTTMPTNQAFVMITTKELQLLTELNASGLCMRVLIALRSFAWDGRSCFPSLAALAERMGYTQKSYKQTISKALKWLEDNNLIIRNSRKSKERFVITDTNERLAKWRTKNEDCKPDGEHKKTHFEIDESPPIVPRGDKQRNRRFSNQEKRERKYQRRRAKIEAAQRQANEAQQKEQLRELEEWKIEHREKQDEILMFTGTQVWEQKVSLMLARFDYESRKELWVYEPPPVSKLGLNLDKMGWYLLTTKIIWNPHFQVFGLGASVETIRDWFLAATD